MYNVSSKLAHLLGSDDEDEDEEAGPRKRSLVHDFSAQWLSGGEDAVDPYTKDVVILNRQQIPVELIKGLAFSNPTKHNSLVCEFEYSKKKGEIFYDIAERDNLEEDGYARLITLNWWYQALFTVLVSTSLIILDLYSNAIFCFNLISRYEDLHVKKEVAYFFPVCYIFLEAWTVGHAYLVTTEEWESKGKGTGDLIVDTHLNRLDAIHAFSAMAAFCFLGVDTLVRDMPVWLHPFKNVQPYSAFKCDGHRCYVIGFASEYMFRCDSMVRQHILQITQIGVRLILLLFKVSCALKTWDVTTILLCLPSVVLLYFRILKVKSIIRDRQKHWEWLNKEWKRLEEIRFRPHSRKLSVAEETKRKKDAENLEKILIKQRDLHFPRTTWGTPFDGWRNMIFRFIRVVVLPGTILVCYQLIFLRFIH